MTVEPNRSLDSDICPSSRSVDRLPTYIRPQLAGEGRNEQRGQGEGLSRQTARRLGRAEGDGSLLRPGADVHRSGAVDATTRRAIVVE